MASNLECLGLGVPDEESFYRLLDTLLPSAVAIGRRGRTSVLRWEDPSGARLVFAVRDDTVEDMVPSFAAEPGVRLDGLTPVNDEVAQAAVLDEGGEQVTSMAVEVEQRALLTQPWSGLAALTALGNDVTVHADADAFGASNASLLNPEHKDAPPPDDLPYGQAWPYRLAAESFLSMGVFGPPEEAHAGALLAGTVRWAELRENTVTGQPFVVARVETLGFAVTACLPSPHAVPEPGNVLAGQVLLVASVPVPVARPGLLGRLRRG